MMQSTGGVTVKVFEKSSARELLILTPRSSLISRNRRLRTGHLKASSLPDQRTMKIAVIGLGYVGLPLAIQFARSNVNVIGLDVDKTKVDLINKGQSYIKHIQSADIAELVTAGKLSASTDFSRIKEVEAVIICVPTPLNKNREPDLSYVLQTGRSIAPHLQEGTLVILESTTYPGTTEEDLRVILEENSSLNPLLSTRRSAACALASTFTWLSRRNARTQGTVRAKSTRSRRLWAVIPSPALSARWKSMAKPLTHWFRCRRAALLKQPSCSRTSFAA